MHRKFLLSLFVFTTLLLGIQSQSSAQTKDRIERLWYNQERTAKIQIYKAVDGKYYGKVVWLKVPLVDGKPKTDIHNPDQAKRNQPIMGLMILKGFKKIDDKEYGDGTIYDPKNGKVYSCKMTYDGVKLDVRGYYGFSWIGRTTTWTKADD